MSRRPILAEEFTGTAAEVKCPTCGELERHQSMDFFRANPDIPIQPGEVIQVRALCARRAAHMRQYWAGGATSYFIELPKESK